MRLAPLALGGGIHRVRHPARASHPPHPRLPRRADDGRDAREEETRTPRFPVAFRFFPDRAHLEAALVGAGYDPALAASTAEEMAAVGGHRQVLLNEQSLAALPWPGRVALLAHELAHGLQYELGGGRRGSSDQWLREGFADWVAMRVLDRLRVLSEGEFRRQRVEQFRRGPARVAGLSGMATFSEWVRLTARTRGAVYHQAFLAADFTIERHGLPAVIDYFSRFARSDDPLENFRAAFGESRAGFESALAIRLGVAKGRRPLCG